MFENFNQPNISNAKGLHLYYEEQNKLIAEQATFKAKEKSEEEAFRTLQVNQNAEANNIAKSSLLLSKVAIVSTIIIGIVSIFLGWCSLNMNKTDQVKQIQELKSQNQKLTDQNKLLNKMK